MYNKEKLNDLALSNRENDHNDAEPNVHVDEHDELHPVELPLDEDETHPEHE